MSIKQNVTEKAKRNNRLPNRNKTNPHSLRNGKKIIKTDINQNGEEQEYYKS